MSEALLAQLVEAPSPDAYLVYADAVQELGDPQGELIALSVRAELSGQPPLERQRELERELAAGIVGDLTNVELRWKSGFVDEITLLAGVINKTTQTGMYERRELSLVRTVRVRSNGSTRHRDGAFVRLVNTKIGPGLTRLEYAANRTPLQPATLATVLDRCPRLVDLGWCVSDVDLDALERHPHLERLAMWNPISVDKLERLVAGPWRLEALVVQPPTTPGQVPPAIAAIVRGERFPELTELGLLSCGFENQLLAALANSPLAARLRVLALAWGKVKADPIRAARTTLANVKLDYALPSTQRESTPDAYWLARHLGRLERRPEALPHAELATRSKPSDYFAWSELGAACDAVERDEDALHAYDQAIALDPNRWYPRASRATALKNLERREEAELELRAAMNLEDGKRVADTYAQLGRLYAGSNRIDDARVAYTSALELAADDADRRSYTWGLVASLVAAGDVAAARATMEAQRACFGSDDDMRRLDAAVALDEGNASRALELVRVRPAIFEGEGRFVWLFIEAAALRELGRSDEARALYQRIIDEADCPAYIGEAWLGQTLIGTDPFATIVGTTPFEIDDQIALRPGEQKVHNSVTHPLDRFYAALAAIVADALCGRRERARVRSEALAADSRRPRAIGSSLDGLVRVALSRLVGEDACDRGASASPHAHARFWVIVADAVQRCRAWCWPLALVFLMWFEGRAASTPVSCLYDLNEPPRTVPPEIAQRIEAKNQATIRSVAAYIAAAVVSWVAFTPLLLAAGILRYNELWWIVMPGAVTIALGLFAARRSRVSGTLQLGILVAMVTASMALSRIFGPLILVPTVIVPLGVVIQGHPVRVMRVVGLALTALAMVVPLLLELLGVLPASYRFADGAITVIPQLTRLPEWFTLTFLTIANVSIAVLPALFVGRLRADLATAQTRELMRSWQLGRLGDDLLRAHRGDTVRA